MAGQDILVKGIVYEAGSNEPLTGVNITVRGTLTGTVSDVDGRFALRPGVSAPFTVEFSFVGYARKQIEILGDTVIDRVDMEPRAILGEEVVISASRVEENIMASPVTIEKMNSRAIEQMPTANFYDGLTSIKGVDMNVHSLTFRFPNTRGFTGETNVRMNQFVDGVDNSSPGLSFSAGNIFGLSNIDVESVELLVGASSALYGPGGMNGVLLMNSKSPFNHEGLTVSLQGGLMHIGNEYAGKPEPMVKLDLRYAKNFNDRLAFKITGTVLEATDWFATDFRDKYRLDAATTRENNEGYDGVNVYGDDIVVPVNLAEVAPAVLAGVAEARGMDPGSQEYNDFINNNLQYFPDQIITRTGWKESDLVDYNTHIYRFNAALHYRFLNDYEAILRGGCGNGSSVYTAQNRFAFENFSMSNIQAEIKNPGFVIRSYYIWEHSGDTYNAGGAGSMINEAWKPSAAWYEDYIAAFTQNILLNPDDPGGAFRFARLVAENRDEHGNIFDPGENAFPVAGTEEFEKYFDQVIATPIHEGGAKVLDKSKMFHTEGMYEFSRMIPWFDLQAGASYRYYIINSEGTVFADKPGEPIGINQYGGYVLVNKELFSDRLRLTLAARYDKNENFKGRATPRFSMVYNVDRKLTHTLRGSVQTAYRFPSIADQWVNLDVGAYRVIGGLPAVHDLYDFNTNPIYPLSSSNPVLGEPVLDHGPYIMPEFEPERVTAYEVGYKGLFLNRLLLLDCYVFVNRFNGFLATQVLVQNPNEDDERRFQTTISTDQPVTAWGWALGLDMMLPKGFYANGNVAYNALESIADRPPGFQSRFNTPRYRFNISAGKHLFPKNIGFKITYRWQDTFLWESAFGVAQMPAYSMLDAQISYRVDLLDTTLKFGGSNILNDWYTTSFGSASIGGLYYLTLIYDGLN